MNINLIGVPINYGCDKDGAQYGPKKIRESGLIKLFNINRVEAYDIGDIYIPEEKSDDKFKSNPNIKYYKSIYDANKNLANVVYMALENESFPIILGGDHSLALGSISGASKYFENLGVVWIDAHGDFNTDDISESKNCHGMALALCCGYGNEELVNIYEESIKVEEENVFHIGGRDFDKKEKELMDSTNLNIYCKNVIDKIGFYNILDDIVKKCEDQNIEALHISLDIDFIDSPLVPGTGTRVNGGYTLEDTKYIIGGLFATGLVRSLDLVEFNPKLDDDDKTLKVCMEILEHIIKSFKTSEVIYC